MPTNPAFTNAALLIGRLLLAGMFIYAGWGKLMGFSSGGVQKFMDANGVPGVLLPLVILTELGGGLLIAFGFQTRIVAFLLAGFTLLASFIFHLKPADQMQMLLFMKNISVTGGFLTLMAAGAGAWSIDGRRAA